MTGDAVAASIAHEVRQPLTAMVTTADAGLRFLDRSSPNLDKAKEAFKRIAADGHRAGAVVGNIRANFKSDVRDRTSFDLNELIQEALALGRGELQKHRIVVQAEPNGQLPGKGNRVQLQQVLLNLIMNAIDAMAAKDEPRILSVKAEAVRRRPRNGIGCGHRDRNPLARRRPDIQPALHDQVRRHGDGPVDLPRHHRGARRPVMVCAEQSPRRRISIHLAAPNAETGSAVFRALQPFSPGRQAIRPPSSS